MSTCIKTGAKVYFEEYGTTVSCDLFEAAGAFVIRFYPEAFYGNGWERKDATHSVFIGTEGYLREDIGIAVVPAVKEQS